MIVLLKESRPVARKEHRCMAFEKICEVDCHSEYTHDELKAYARMRENKGNIQKGERYIRQTCRGDDGLYDYIANAEMDAICWKYDLFEE